MPTPRAFRAARRTARRIQMHKRRKMEILGERMVRATVDAVVNPGTQVPKFLPQKAEAACDRLLDIADPFPDVVLFTGRTRYAVMMCFTHAFDLWAVWDDKRSAPPTSDPQAALVICPDAKPPDFLQYLADLRSRAVQGRDAALGYPLLSLAANWPIPDGALGALVSPGVRRFDAGGAPALLVDTDAFFATAGSRTSPRSS